MFLLKAMKKGRFEIESSCCDYIKKLYDYLGGHNALSFISHADGKCADDYMSANCD